jgi:hypothetical protein
MTTAQKGIITENEKLLELLLEMIIKKDNSIFNQEVQDATLIAICAMKALLNSINREENTKHLFTNN